MKALDTGVLLALLEGSAKAREQLRKLRGVELATTEANLLELSSLAVQGVPRSRSSRLAALDKLRRRLTVLPIGPRTLEELSARPVTLTGRFTPTVAQMLGTLEAAGCDELLTDDPRVVVGDWSFKVRVVSV